MPPQFESVDLWASLKYIHDGETSYCPLMIQFKARETYSVKQATAALLKLKTSLEGNRGVGLLMISGSDTNYDESIQNVTGHGALTVSTQLKQMEVFLGSASNASQAFLIVSIPNEDPFGVREFVEQTSVGRKESEVIMSHEVVGYLAPIMDRQTTQLLLRSDTAQKSTEYQALQKLVDDFVPKKIE